MTGMMDVFYTARKKLNSQINVWKFKIFETCLNESRYKLVAAI